MIVLDTAPLIFWTLDPQRLSSNAKRLIEESDAICVSSISIWEIAIKIRRRMLSIPLQMRDYLEKLKDVERLEILPVSEETWLTNVELDWKHKDPADRTIVATAMLLNCPLITSDKLIRRFYTQAQW